MIKAKFAYLLSLVIHVQCTCTYICTIRDAAPYGGGVTSKKWNGQSDTPKNFTRKKKQGGGGIKNSGGDHLPPAYLEMMERTDVCPVWALRDSTFRKQYSIE